MVEPGRPDVLVLGIGNPDRGDDGVGRFVARALRASASAGLEIAEADGEPTTLFDELEGRKRVLIVDACVTGGRAGVIHRFDVAAAPLPAAVFGLSSHGLGVNHALELARALGALPSQCAVYAIEGANFAAGAPISPQVAKAARRLAASLAIELSSELETSDA